MDHKSLFPLFGHKLVEELPLHVQRFRMRMMRYSFAISHVPGKNLTTADALSRAPISKPCSEDLLLQEESDAYIQAVLQSLPSSQGRLQEIQTCQDQDEVCREVMTYCRKGWPGKTRLLGTIKHFHSVASELLVENRLLL